MVTLRNELHIVDTKTEIMQLFKFNIHTVHYQTIRRDQQYALIVPLLYYTYCFLHVSAVACHYPEAY
jgi:hypothetical protein